MATLSSVHPGLAERIIWIRDVAKTYGLHTSITSGYRSPQIQRALYANRASNPYPVAPPGCSAHEFGLAVDLVPVGVWAGDSRAQDFLGQLGRYVGLFWSPSDPVHFQAVSNDDLVQITGCGGGGVPIPTTSSFFNGGHPTRSPNPELGSFGFISPPSAQNSIIGYGTEIPVPARRLR